MISDSPNTRHRGHISSFTNVIHYSISGILIVLLMLSTSSCKLRPEIQQETLYGKWDILQASRNGNETHYLRGGYIIIDMNGTMTINLTGTEEKGPYTIRDKTIRVGDSKDFLIESLQPDSMTMRYVMSPESEFLIQLIKHKDESK